MPEPADAEDPRQARGLLLVLLVIILVGALAGLVAAWYLT